MKLKDKLESFSEAPALLSAGILLCLGWVCGLSLTVVGALESWLVRDLSLGHGQTGLTQSAFFAGNLLGSLLVGVATERWRPRIVGLTALLVMAAGNALAGGGSLALLVIGRLLAGVGLSSTMVFSSAVLVERFPARQGALLNGLHAAIALGAASAMAGGRPLAELFGRWQASPLAVAALSLLFLVPLCLLPLPTLAGREPGGGAAVVLRLLRLPALWGVLLVMAGYLVAEQGVTTFGPAFVEKARGLDPRWAGLLGALLWTGLGVGRVLSALLLGIVAERTQIVACLAGGLLLLLASLVVPTAMTMAALLLLAGLVLAPVIPLAFSQSTRLAPQHKGVVLGLANAVGCLGGTVGPLFIGTLADRWTLRGGLSAGYLLALATVVPFVLLGRKSGKISGG